MTPEISDLADKAMNRVEMARCALAAGENVDPEVVAALIETIDEQHATLTHLSEQADAGWKFARELSEALIKIRPLGGSELFVQRNGQYYADPAYCGAAIEAELKRRHEAMADRVLLERRVKVLEMVIREELVPAFCDCDANRMIVEGIHTPVSGSTEGGK